MTMHNPPHPGEFINEVYLEPNGISGRELAATLGVAPSTLNRVLRGNNAVSPEMALRLSIALGRLPESWLAMQDRYDLWQARQRLDLRHVTPIHLTARRHGVCKVAVSAGPMRPGRNMTVIGIAPALLEQVLGAV